MSMVVWENSHTNLVSSVGGVNNADKPKPKSSCALKFWIVTTAVLGGFLLCTGLATHPLVQKIVTSQVNKQVDLTDQDTDVFRTFASPSENGVEPYLQMVIWNITNGEGVLNGEIPVVAPVGPYTYTERRKKHSFQYNDDKSILYYKQNVTYHYLDVPCKEGTDPFDFDQKCSIPEDTLVNTINVPLTGLIQELAPLGVVEKWLINFFNESIPDPELEVMIMQRNVTDIVFGYEDEILEFIKEFVKEQNWTLDLDLPPYVILANNSVDDRTKFSSINTKATDGNFAAFRSWQMNNGTVPYWHGCDVDKDAINSLYNYLGSMINGTEGSCFQPGVQKSDELYVFVDALYRSGLLQYNNSETIGGLECYRFTLAEVTMLNVTQYAPNCAFSSTTPSGILNMEPAVGAPIIASKPFFVDADPFYRENLTNFPDAGRVITPEVFDTFLDIEPTTGTVFRAQKRLQTSVRVVRNANVEATTLIQEFYFPIMYADESFTLPNNITSEIQKQLQPAKDLEQYYKYAGPILGAILLMVSTYLGYKLYQRNYGLADGDLEFAGSEIRPLLMAHKDSASVGIGSSSRDILA